MTNTYKQYKGIKGLCSFIADAALRGEHQDYTTGSLRRAVFMLAIPMMLEMCMESIFAVVDIFFVSKLGALATATVGLTESVLTLIYSVAMGLSMAATAMVARRIGEKNPEEAARSGAQSIVIAISLSLLVSIAGLFFAADILRLMGGSEQVVAYGKTYAQIMLTGNIVIMLLFLLNGIFRGAGNASIAMKSLFIANLCNVILCPLCIHWFGLKGAAIATTTGRGIGVCYQLYNMFKGKGIIRMALSYFIPSKTILTSLLSIAFTATMQFIVASASWIAMARLMARFGDNAIAGYTIGIRLIVFFILPAFGLSNAAATLVGQNLGAQQPDRAAKSVWMVAKYNAIFMAAVSLLFLLAGPMVVSWISKDAAVQATAVQALRIISAGYIFYGVGMVMMNAFNGAGDSKTPTYANLFWFWIFQIPVAYLAAIVWNWGPTGVFVAVVVTESCLAITSVLLFKRGKWKQVKI
jgi:putative MATE family efflux protein